MTTAKPRENTPRRDSDRFLNPIRVLVFWRKNGPERFEADICDISIGGCFINTRENAADGENITLEVPTLVPDEVMEFSGTVVPQSRTLYGFGVRFGELNESQRSLISKLIDRAEKQPDRRT
jgi:hypothetical protein